MKCPQCKRVLTISFNRDFTRAYGFCLHCDHILSDVGTGEDTALEAYSQEEKVEATEERDRDLLF